MEHAKLLSEGLSVSEVNALLFNIRDTDANICIRFQIEGQSWQDKFYRLLILTTNDVILNDESSNRLTFVPFDNILQFEIDNQFQDIPARVPIKVFS